MSVSLSLKNHFLLDPAVIFLNHGSFGATPRPVMDAYQGWQLRLERQPVQFITREMLGELEKARQVLGKFLNAPAEDLVYIPNATFGVNLIARSLQLEPGDEILTTDHEYGACENVWKFVCQKNGAIIVKQPIPFPMASPAEIVEQLWQGVTPKTKAIFISHVTSPTAVRMPAEIMCQQAREAGILTVIDGAHAPGQIPLNLDTIDPDFYVGNCHKWMLSPKGAGFLYTRRALQPLLEPLVVSWGWGVNAPFDTGSAYLDQLEWMGTNDPSAYLSVPAAIKFMEDYHWPDVQARCHQALKDSLQAINQLTGLPTMYRDDCQPFAQMAIAQLPTLTDLPGFQAQLYDRYRVEVPCIQWKDQQFVRLSVQGYNTPEELEVFKGALVDLLPQATA